MTAMRSGRRCSATVANSALVIWKPPSPATTQTVAFGGSAALLWTSAVFIVGPKNAGHVRGMGFTPVATYAEAFERARKVLGERDPKVLCTPECFTGGVTVHLYRK